MADKADEIMERDKDSGEENYRSPLGVSADEDGPDGFIRVNIVFPGLKKKLLKNVASNANLDLKILERSMNLLLTMSKDKKKLEKYQYKVKKFHADVIPGKSYHKIRENQVVVFLKKAEDKSWARELSEYGLEAYEEEEEEEDMDVGQEPQPVPRKSPNLETHEELPEPIEEVKN